VKYWKIIFFPIALIYGCVVWVRNLLYDKQLKRSYSIPGKSIVVGNLSMGGTGKSPHIVYLWNLLKNRHNVAILSRGYGRKTKGLIEVFPEHTAVDVGDEPLMFKRIAGEKAVVVVSENRKKGVDFIRAKHNQAIILFDDAFQHRRVVAGLSILLTDYHCPYYNDIIFPVGTLRECRKGANRAQIVIVSKCPAHLSHTEKQQIRKQLRHFSIEHIFFSHIAYGELRSFGQQECVLPVHSSPERILLVAGIANPQPLLEYLTEFFVVETLFFPDHHNFSTIDIRSILNKFDSFASPPVAIVTTEKDFVRLKDVLSDNQTKDYPWYYQAIDITIDREKELNTLILEYAE